MILISNWDSLGDLENGNMATNPQIVFAKQATGIMEFDCGHVVFQDLFEPFEGIILVRCEHFDEKWDADEYDEFRRELMFSIDSPGRREN